MKTFLTLHLNRKTLISNINMDFMKSVFSLVLLFAGQLAFSQDQNGADDILGVWLTGTKNGKVEIYKKGNTYQGKIVWLSEPLNPKTAQPKTDINHPDEKLHTRPILGLINTWGFSYEGDGSWENGHIYDPKNGKEYKCVITMKDKNSLNVRGYIGITLMGRTDVWTRTKL
jgi:hypothetical protein